MTISRVKSPDWAVGEKLTSAQQNALDANVTNALDKRSGQTDTLASVVSCSGAGRIVSTLATANDADQTFQAGGGNLIVRIPTLTAQRSYTLGHTGVATGDRIFFYFDGTNAFDAKIKNNAGTEIFRLGKTTSATPHGSPEGDSVECIYNGSAWVVLHGAGPGMRTIEFTSTGATAWTCPPGVYSVILIGWGSGGSGAGGASGPAVVDNWGSGGAGGGGALLSVEYVPVTPGTVYEGVITAGGASVAANTAGANGGDTTFKEQGGSTLATFRGGSGGGSPGTSAAVGTYAISIGGASVRRTSALPAAGLQITASAWNHPRASPEGPGCGGQGVGVNYTANAAVRDGFPSIQGWNGGLGATHGSDSGSYRGGGAGAGGGGGPGSIGGDGGNGGNGNNAGAGVAGQAAGSADPNSGAGGGGGGGGGGGSGGGGAGGASGAGGSGKLRLVFFK